MTAAEAEEPDVSLRITVESPVVTRDQAKIGKVKEIRGRFFKIAMPHFWKRDFWLRSDIVETAVPDEMVVLAIDQADLDDYKVEEPLAA
ncbi:MAG TPA: hypothetical protein VGK54_19550 [Chloroflexota bacterium]|jgi:hypothetical protein